MERVWRTVKYEEAYLRSKADGWYSEISLARFFWRYGDVRPRTSLGGKSSNEMNKQIGICSSRPELTMSESVTVQ